MTNIYSIKTQLSLLLDCNEEDIQKYNDLIVNTALAVCAQVINPEDENANAIVHLCAVEAYYRILLLENSSDEVTSFKAGDVSYTANNTALLERARELLSLARQDCGNLISDSSFAFGVM